MREKPFVTRKEWLQHVDSDWRTVHDIWAHIKTYVPGHGYSKAEVDAMWEGYNGTRGQVAWTNVTGKPATYPPSAHAASHEVGGADLLAFADITGFGDYLDQAVKIASSPTHANLTITTAILMTGAGAGKNIKFQGTHGGGGEGITYEDAGGTGRFGLIFPGSDVVALVNRASNGTVEIRANTAVAGGVGEVTVATFEDDLITFAIVVSGEPPTIDAHLATKKYVDDQIGGVNEFTELTDTPANYAGSAGKFVKVNAVPDALEFASLVKADITDTPWAWADVSKVGSNLTDLATRQHAGLTNMTSDQHHAQLHAAAHADGQGDELSHDALKDYVIAEHLSLSNTIANVLSDHNKAVHDALNIDADTVDGEEAAAIVTKARVDAIGASHDSLVDVSVDDHHAQAHTLASHSTKAHSELTGVTSDLHHVQLHAASHADGQGDELSHNALKDYVAARHYDWTNETHNLLTTGTIRWSEFIHDVAVDFNLFLGKNAGAGIQAGGKYNLFVGEDAGQALTTGDNNIILGYQAGYNNETGIENVIIGSGAAKGAVGENFNYLIAIGYRAGYSHTTGPYNVFIGSTAGYFNTTGYENFYLGYQVGYFNSTGHDNVGIGTYALTGVSGQNFNYNVAIGSAAIMDVSTGHENVAVGYQAATNLITSNYTVAIGSNALDALTSGSYNIAIGSHALTGITTTGKNVGVGHQVGYYNRTGEKNVFIGYYCQIGNGSCSENTFVGHQAGYSTTTGGQSVLLGSDAGHSLTTNGGCVFIGYQAGYNETGANKLYIANTNTATPLIYGEFDNALVAINGKFGIGTMTIPHGGVGYAQLAIEGGVDAAGPHVQFTNTVDDYPLMQFLIWDNDSLYITFDGYYDGTWRSSDVGSNFVLKKEADKFVMAYDSGIAPGAAVTWNDGFILDIAGGIFMPGLKSGATQVAAGAAVGELWYTNGHASLPNNVMMIGV